MTIRSLAELILELTGSKSSIVYEELPKDDPRIRQPDIRRAKKILGWEPRTPLREGLQKTLVYFERLLRKSGALKS
jgi:nucleoside-diphosphate-sugar epimerase